MVKYRCIQVSSFMGFIPRLHLICLDLMKFSSFCFFFFYKQTFLAQLKVGRPVYCSTKISLHSSNRSRHDQTLSVWVSVMVVSCWLYLAGSVLNLYKVRNSSPEPFKQHKVILKKPGKRSYLYKIRTQKIIYFTCFFYKKVIDLSFSIGKQRTRRYCSTNPKRSLTSAQRLREPSQCFGAYLLSNRRLCFIVFFSVGLFPLTKDNNHFITRKGHFSSYSSHGRVLVFCFTRSHSLHSSKCLFTCVLIARVNNRESQPNSPLM